MHSTLGAVIESMVLCDGCTKVSVARTLDISVEDLRDIIAGRLTVQPSVARNWATRLGHCPDTWASLAWNTWGIEAEAEREVDSMYDECKTDPRIILWGEGK
jgi:plasmid maintenance system antidote protein VapI